MLLSMTGFGSAQFQTEALSVSVEVRAVNNRFLKVNTRCTEPYHTLEADIEKAVRQVVRRGTVHVQLRVQRSARPEDYRLNSVALRAYLDQLRAFELESSELVARVPVADLLGLPGVVAEPDAGQQSPADDWPCIERVLNQALAKLDAMRREEGRAMAAELRQLVGRIGEELGRVRARAPQVVAAYRQRLHERIEVVLSGLNAELDQATMIKEVAVFAERSDITEEGVRLASHLEQFGVFLQEAESSGRKLDFLVQEMGREANTIGSKANDLEIARHVVEIKGAIEKVRELIQNVE